MYSIHTKKTTTALWSEGHHDKKNRVILDPFMTTYYPKSQLVCCVVIDPTKMYYGSLPYVHTFHFRDIVLFDNSFNKLN